MKISNQTWANIAFVIFLAIVVTGFFGWTWKWNKDAATANEQEEKNANAKENTLIAVFNFEGVIFGINRCAKTPSDPDAEKNALENWENNPLLFASICGTEANFLLKNYVLGANDDIKKIRDDYFADREIRSVKTYSKILENIKEGDIVRAKIAVIQTGADWTWLYIISAETVKRYPPIKAALILKYKNNEEDKKIRLARLEEMLGSSEYWQLEIGDAWQRMEIDPPKQVLIDEENMEILVEIEIPVMLAEFFPEREFSDDDRLVIYAITQRENCDGHYGMGTPINAIRFLRVTIPTPNPLQ
jgi:hypothetical protein